ncbi:pyridoxal phosphate-dependent aminotransferase [Micromonospora haikouensis]|uniref:pyridoxal phosphate-dependent aminotransferase n=1 Tax=Micromonospora haikouensis TaxID=686309 RepID=UPI003D70CFC8
MFVLDEMAHEYEKKHDDVIRMTLGKSELPPSAPVVEAMLAPAADYRTASLVFPAGLPQLRDRLALEYQQRYGVHLPSNRFVISTGTSTTFRNLHQLLVTEGDEVLVPLPCYPLYVFTARLVGARVRHYRVDPHSLEVDLASLEAAMTPRTRVVIVNSPGNPFGNVVDRRRFLEIDAIVAGRATLVSDEIYVNCLFDDEPYSAAELMGNSFSKGHRMYARRVGYAIVGEEPVEPMSVIQHHKALTTDPVPQFGAIAALDSRRTSPNWWTVTGHGGTTRSRPSGTCRTSGSYPPAAAST